MRKPVLLATTLITLLSTMIWPSSVQGQDQELTTFILFRHAEKADDGSRDPDLNEKGRQRAERLAELLQNVGITAIYSTPYKRTRQTVQPIAAQKNLPIREYDPYDLEILDVFLRSGRGGVALIAAHSNTTPALVNTLLGEERFAKLDESDYSQIFVVTVQSMGEGNVIHLTY